MTAPLTDEQALLRAILTEPAADLPRLVLADWLDEHADGPCRVCDGAVVSPSGFFGAFGPFEGGRCPRCSGTGRVSGSRRERAEFIRVQCELGTADPCGLPAICIHGPSEPPFGPQQTKPSCGKSACKSRDRLRQREKSLFGRYGTDWLAGFYGDLAGVSVKMARGFVAEVRLPLAEYLALARDLFAAHPVTAVRLADREPTDYGRRDNSTVCFWEPGHRQPGRHQLPFELTQAGERLPGGVWKSDFPMPGLMAYPFADRGTAHIALSAAAVALGRQMAGLPPLTPGGVR